MNTLSQRELQVHVPVVAWLMIVGHALLLCAGAFVLALLGGVGLAVREDPATPILFTVGALVAVFLAVLALPGLAAGVGLLLRQGWARYLAIVVALLGLINFPLGTLIGLYSAWVLFQDGATDYFGPRPASGQ